MKTEELLRLAAVVLVSASMNTRSASALEPGDLDPSFGDRGVVQIDFPGSKDDIARGCVVVQAGGKIVLAGTSSTAATSDDFALARYNADGSLDDSFGDGGRVTTDFPLDHPSSGSSDRAYGVAADPNGRVVVVGTDGQRFAVARYNQDGSLDSTFGDDGRVSTDFGPGGDYATSVLVDKDGKIVVAGSAYVVGEDVNFALARYEPDGSLDATFGVGGKVTTDFGAKSDQSWGVSMDSSGKIVLAGKSYLTTGVVFALARYFPDGSLDTTFGGDGRVTTDFGEESPACYGWAVAIDGTDRIVVAGNVRGDFALARYNLDGSLDPGFGGGGTVRTNFGDSADGAYSVAIDGNGRIVAAGFSTTDWYNDVRFAVACYDEGGSLDPSFDGDGKATTTFESVSYAWTVDIDLAGRIVVAGETEGPGFYPYGPEGRNFAVARYNLDGTLDGSFGTDGKVTTDFVASSTDSAVDVVACQSDGKIVVGGGSDWSCALARLHADGTLDATFGTDGKVTVPLGFDSKGVAAGADDRIVVAGNTFTVSTRYDFTLVRFHPDGDLDPTFGSSGIVRTDFSGADDHAEALAIDPDGRIVAAGRSLQPGSKRYDFALVRYEPDGSLDVSFGSGGKVTTDFDFTQELIRAIAIQPDGRIVAAGTIENPTHDFALARYESAGSLDTTFGTGGLVTTHFGGVSDVSLLASVVIDGEGRIIAAGSYGANGTERLALARYNADGSLDDSFDGDGMAATGFPMTVNKVVIDRQGRIVLAGVYSGYPHFFMVARFTTDGNPDLNFSRDGFAHVNLGLWTQAARGVDIDRDGNIVAAGDSWLLDSGTGSDFILARFISDVNQPPICTLTEGEPVECQGSVTMIELDGTSASDPDGDPLTYVWETDCPRAAFDDPTSPSPALSVDTSIAGQAILCTVTLTVTDPTGASDTCSRAVETWPCVPVDIKPRGCPNPVNTQERSKIPVAILGTADFDVTKIEPASIRLEGVPPLGWTYEDVTAPHAPFRGKEDCFDCTEEGPDDHVDVNLKFATREVIARLGGVEDAQCLALRLTGNLREDHGGTPVVGEDVAWFLDKRGGQGGDDEPLLPRWPFGTLFIRGDANGDGEIDLSDAISTLGYLFLEGNNPSCLDAIDTNDDGELDLSDAISSLNFLFLGSRPFLRSPFPGCGHDPTEDALGCEKVEICNGS